MVCLKILNRVLLNYSLGGLCHFPAGGYTHAALETVWNRLHTFFHKKLIYEKLVLGQPETFGTQASKVKKLLVFFFILSIKISKTQQLILIKTCSEKNIFVIQTLTVK